MLARRLIALSPEKAFAKQLGVALRAAGGVVDTHLSYEELGTGELSAALVVIHLDGAMLDAFPQLLTRLDSDAKIIVILARPNLPAMVDIMQASELIAGMMVADGFDSTLLSAMATRVLAGDIFGLEKHIPWGAQIHSYLVGDYQEKSLCIAQISEFCEAMSVRRKYRESIEQCLDEMLMNALYDAPVDEQGRPIFAEIPTKTRISLRVEQKVVVQYVCDGKQFAVAVRDSFGRLERQVVLRYLYKCLHSEQQIDRKTGGAGVVLLTATPAKNSPLEFYNLIQYIDPTAFTKAGILDPEQFIDRFIKIEYREVMDSSFDISMKSAVTGFKSLDDLRTIILTYAEFRTAAEVGLKLPRPVVETLMVKMDDEQEAKYAHYVAQIEDILSNPNPEGGESNAILGLLARLSLVALHADLEAGYNYRTALEGGSVKRRRWDDGALIEYSVRLSRPTYESPKLVECAKRVAASPHCGHIIFCEPTAVHQWMREVLVQHGIPRERIAILNADETAPADRIRIAREFNGLSSEPPPPGTCARPTDSAVTPKYDVVIANSVAYEGVDLQVRTCTIHHLDLPWTPADLEQRNGRAVRQGNTLGIVQIYYYFADGSTDGYRFSLIDGKAGWLGELIKSQVRDTNNPAAQQQLTPEDILLMISRDKDKTRAMLEDKRRRQAEEARKRIALEATRLYRQAAARFRAARVSDDAEAAARLREEGELRLADLERVDADAWPWAPWMYAARDLEVLIPDTGAPVYEGLRIARGLLLALQLSQPAQAESAVLHLLDASQ